jgi:hypothetical protein
MIMTTTKARDATLLCSGSNDDAAIAAAAAASAAASDQTCSVSMAELLIHELSFWEPTPKEVLQQLVRRSRSFDDGFILSKPIATTTEQQQHQQQSRSQSMHEIWKDEEEEKKSSNSPPPHSSTKAVDNNNIAAQLEELKQSNTWEKALDAGTGKYYYYCRVTRQSQWDKPRSIREMEKLSKILQRQESEAFFRIMEANIYASLARGEVIPNVPDPLPKEGPPQEPPTNANTVQSSSSLRVRTISGMNEHLLAELQAQSAFASTTTTTASSRNSNNHHHHPAAAAFKTHPAEKGRPPLPPSMANNITTTTTNPFETAVVVPHTTTANAVASFSINNQTNIVTSSSIPPQDDDLLELSPDWESQPSSHKSTSTSTNNMVESEGLQGLDYLLPEETNTTTTTTNQNPSMPTTSTTTLSQSTMVKQQHQSQNQQKNNNNNNPSMTIGRPAPLGIHMRRNTSSNYYVRETMEKPDIDATIQCVCGVLRAHIVQNAAANPIPPTLPPHVVRIDWTIFQDAPNYKTTRNSIMTPKPVPQIPSLEEIKAFYLEFYQRSQMEHDTIIMSLIYVERLIKETHGALTPSPDNWMSLLFACMILASKVWDDLSMWNVDFSNVSVSSSSLKPFSLQRINELELAVLTCLRFAVTIQASEYAKYFFLLRTMMIRGGLAKIMPPNPTQEHASELEVRTSHYQDTILLHNKHESEDMNGAAGLPRRRQTRSVDWSWLLGQKSSSASVEPLSSAMASSSSSHETDSKNNTSRFHRPEDEPSLLPSGPVLREQVCLEQLAHT